MSSCLVLDSCEMGDRKMNGVNVLGYRDKERKF